MAQIEIEKGEQAASALRSFATKAAPTGSTTNNLLVVGPVGASWLACDRVRRTRGDFSITEACPR